MTYYAVTNDPNELMHFGIKGMKWGVIRTPEQLGHHEPPKKTRTKTAKPKETKPRSPAYQKASAKLSRAMRAGIAKAQANWAEYNSPYNKAQREYNRALKRDERAYKRNEKAFQKHLQLAREGRLKYKGISDEEVGRITDRLALERSSRLLSGTEKQSFGRRLRERVGEGVIEGAGRGVSGYVANRIEARGRAKAEIKAERMKTRAQYTPSGWIHRKLESHLDNAESKQQAKRESKRENYKYKHSQQRIDADKEARETAEENYLAAVEENRALGYDRTLGSDTDAYARLHGYSTNRRAIKRLSTAELKGRTAAIDEAARLYGKAGDARIKSLYSGKDVQARDDDGNPLFDSNGDPIMETTYGGGSSGSKGKKGKNKNKPTATDHPNADIDRPANSDTSDGSSDRDEWSRYNGGINNMLPSDARYMKAFDRGVSRAGKQHSQSVQFRRTTAGVNTMDELADEINAQEAARRTARAQKEEAERQQKKAERDWKRKQEDIERRKADRKKAQDEGLGFYEARRISRERDPDEYLPSAPTREQVRANPYMYLPNYGKHTKNNGYGVTRTGTRTDRATATSHPDASLIRPSNTPNTVDNTMGNGSQYSPNSSVTVTSGRGYSVRRTGRKPVSTGRSKDLINLRREAARAEKEWSNSEFSFHSTDPRAKELHDRYWHLQMQADDLRDKRVRKHNKAETRYYRKYGRFPDY